jgi:3-oxoacyl-(acyl-carrier-protein) synthase
VSVRAAITGLGAVSGFGRGVDRLWRALVAGDRAMRPRVGLVDGAGHALDVGPLSIVDDVPFEAPSRAQQLALLAAREALEDAGLSTGGAEFSDRGSRVAVACGTTLGGIGNWLPLVRATGESGARVASSSSNDASAQLNCATAPLNAPARWGWAGPAQAVAAAFDARGPLVVPSVACASGNVALGEALALVRDGTCDVVIAGGADSIHDFVIAGFAALKALDPEPCRPFDRHRRGLNLGEGAAFLVVESEAHARARGATIRAWLDGYGISADAVHMTGPDREGRGAARAMSAAVADAGLRPDAVDFVSAHGTATPFNDLMEAKALPLVLGARAATTPIDSIKSAIGHTLGAAAAIEAVVCVRVLETGLVPPTPGLAELDPEIALDVVRDRARQISARVTLSTASGFGGTNAAIVITAR